MTDIMTPTLGESVTEATVARWAKKAGDSVKRDELLVELETDKVNLEVAAPEDGVLSEIAAEVGETVVPGQRLGRVGAAAGSAASQAKAGRPQTTSPKAGAPADTGARPTSGAVAADPLSAERRPLSTPATLSPAVRRLVAEQGLDPASVSGSGRDGRITKGDALAAVEARSAQAQQPSFSHREVHAREERVPMTRLRQTIARRLKEAQNAAAMLTTFNEVDMSSVIEIRGQYKEMFEQRHGVKLGFMGFFVKACVAALMANPAVNAEIDGTDLIYKNHYDIGVAVGTDRGLVVPVLRDADSMNLAQIEQAIGLMGRKARDGTLGLDDLQGGTFTISNGGVYGSLMSTPILNAPQSGILGMHKILDRAVVIAGSVAVRPMMYLALTYDHRVVDGQGAVEFLVRVKETIEDPRRLVLEV
ncbi:MAG TPA: 2-oxoglutarate dehydrogenase complex dihydrolipoyllysine-residue succinyltransferase [Caulobacteraceae bacterium]